MDVAHRGERPVRLTAAPLLGGLLAATAVIAPMLVLQPLALRRRPHTSPAQPSRATWRPHPLVVVVASSMLLGLVAAPLALLPPVVRWAHHRLRSMQAAARAARQVTGSLPDAVGLLLLCTDAGWTLPLAHARCAPLIEGGLGEALSAADLAAQRGRPRAEALLEALAPLGDRSRALAHVLADHLRYGTPLAPGLERLGLELRLDRRRLAEEAARRVPVRLLAPLVLCVLPAFGLLTVVPLVATSLRSLPS